MTHNSLLSPCLSESELGNAELLKFCNNETSEIQEVQQKPLRLFKAAQKGICFNLKNTVNWKQKTQHMDNYSNTHTLLKDVDEGSHSSSVKGQLRNF